MLFGGAIDSVEVRGPRKGGSAKPGAVAWWIEGGKPDSCCCLSPWCMAPLSPSRQFVFFLLAKVQGAQTPLTPPPTPDEPLFFIFRHFGPSPHFSFPHVPVSSNAFPLFPIIFQSTLKPFYVSPLCLSFLPTTPWAHLFIPLHSIPFSQYPSPISPLPSSHSICLLPISQSRQATPLPSYSVPTFLYFLLHSYFVYPSTYF